MWCQVNCGHLSKHIFSCTHPDELYAFQQDAKDSAELLCVISE